MVERQDIAAKMEGVAKALLGEPNSKMRRKTEWRYGRKGSLCINLAKGTWFDHEAGEGGGVLDLIKREIGCTTPAAIEWLQGELGEYVPTVQPVSSAEQEREQSNLRDAALRIWRDCKPAKGTLVQTYLQNRHVGFGAELADIGFHPRCPFGKNEAGEQVYHPCMVALVRSPGDLRPLGIHRTALTMDGLKIDRKMLGPCHGGVVVLSPHKLDDEIGIAEGIETALSASRLFERPVWATLNAGSMAAFEPLGGVGALTIFADNDVAGEKASQACAQEWVATGAFVEIEMPMRDGWDFNDVLAAFERGELAS